jgi:hypothetical protein
VRTVESHLYRAMHKLGVTNRQQLPAPPGSTGHKGRAFCRTGSTACPRSQVEPGQVLIFPVCEDDP